MQALDNKVIIYDDVCPLCKGYTACFVHFGWIPQRSGFATTDPALLQRIDLDRARHEIPLHDLQTGETVYGLDAMFLILGTRFPRLRLLFRNRLFRLALYQLYQIITYNRRVIAGSRAPAAGFDCAPDVHPFYRWLYIGLALAGTALLLAGPFLDGNTLLNGLFIGQGVLLMAALFSRRKLDFAGHWSTVFLAGALLWRLLPNLPVLQAGILVVLGWMWFRRASLLF